MGMTPQQLRDGYAAFGSGDFEKVKSNFSDDVIFHVGGNNSFSGDYKGWDEVLGFFARLAQETQGSFKFDLHDVLTSDEHAVGLAHVTATRGDKTLDQNVVHVYHTNDEGQITEAWTFPEDSALADEFWS
jgi:uncharacterized protein